MFLSTLATLPFEIYQIPNGDSGRIMNSRLTRFLFFAAVGLLAIPIIGYLLRELRPYKARSKWMAKRWGHSPHFMPVDWSLQGPFRVAEVEGEDTDTDLYNSD